MLLSLRNSILLLHSVFVHASLWNYCITYNVLMKLTYPCPVDDSCIVASWWCLTTFTNSFTESPARHADLVSRASHRVRPARPSLVYTQALFFTMPRLTSFDLSRASCQDSWSHACNGQGRRPQAPGPHRTRTHGPDQSAAPGTFLVMSSYLYTHYNLL